MNIEQLVIDARNGNSESQFKYALVLLKKEQVEECFYWLHKAVALKNVRAIELLGLLVLKGHGVRADPVLAFEYFRSAAVTGDGQALMRCAELMFSGKGIIKNRSGAIFNLISSAKQGYPLALRALGFFLLRQGDSNGAVSAFRIAAYSGEPQCQYMMARLASSPTEANAWMALAAQNGVYLAKKVHVSGSKQADLSDLERDLPAQWEIVLSTLSTFNLLDDLVPQVDNLSETANIKTIKNILSPFEAEYLINLSAGLLNPVKVVSADATIQLEKIRTGMTASLGKLLDVVVDWLIERICKAVNLPLSHAETPAVIRYFPGEMYKQHGDYLPENSELVAEVNGGQRTNTVLVYLNDDFLGGCTAFNLLNLVVKPEQGLLLTFSNVLPSGEALVLSQHTGEVVFSGEKWLLSIWFRQYSLTSH